MDSRSCRSAGNPCIQAGSASQTFLGIIAPTISPLGSIVEFARTVQPSRVALAIYNVKRSNKKHTLKLSPA